MAGSPGRATAVTKSLPGMCGKPRKFTRVGELGLAGGELLVAAGGDGEGVAGRDRVRHRLPQLERGGARRRRGARTSCARPALAPEVKVTRPRVNQSPAKPPRPVAVNRRRLDGGDDGAGAAEGGVVEIDGAAGIAEVGVAAVLEEPALGLLQVVGEAAHLGGEGGAGAAHLAELPERISTRWAVSCQLTRQISMAASSNRPAARSSSLRLSDAERALHLQVVDGEADAHP